MRLVRFRPVHVLRLPSAMLGLFCASVTIQESDEIPQHERIFYFFVLVSLSAVHSALRALCRQHGGIVRAVGQSVLRQLCCNER